MERLTVSRWAWEARRQCRALTRRFGVAGYAVLSCAVAVAAAWIWAHAQRLEAAQWSQRAAMLGEQVAASAPTVATARDGDRARLDDDRARLDDDRSRLEAFDRQLAAHDRVTAVLGELLAAGERSGLQIDRGHYRLTADDAGRFMRFRMTLPMTGDVATLRRFVRDALRAHPSLALENLRIERETIDARTVQAQVQWSLLLRMRNEMSPIEAAQAPSPGVAR